MAQQDWTAFPKDIKKRPYHIYPKKGVISVDGYKTFKLKDLNKVPLGTRLVYFPHELFAAIHRAGNQGKQRHKDNNIII